MWTPPHGPSSFRGLLPTVPPELPVLQVTTLGSFSSVWHSTHMTSDFCHKSPGVLWTNNVQCVHELFYCSVITNDLCPGPFSIKRPPLWGQFCCPFLSKVVGGTTKFLISQPAQGTSVSQARSVSDGAVIGQGDASTLIKDLGWIKMKIDI